MSLSLRTAFVVVLLLLAPVTAFAEGTAQVETNQNLASSTAIKVDIIHHATESITWTGTGTATITNPSGTTVATLSSGNSYSPIVDGTFGVTLSSSQSGAWDITVSGTTAGFGRVHSQLWNFATGSFASSASSNASYYALIPGGSPGTSGVVELKLKGLSGNTYSIGANLTGVGGANAGRSVATSGNSFTPSFEMYLLPPEISTYNPVTPAVSNFAFTAGTQSCNLIVPGTTTGSFKFDTNVTGTYNLVCDLDRDGVYNRVSSTDLLLVGTTVSGTNTVSWDGKNNAGTNVAVNSYDCKVFVNTGELHFVGNDIETSYEGLRLYAVDASLAKTPLDMFWNDTAVQGSDVNMPAPTNVQGLTTSGANGINSASYASAADPNVNAHSWGNFNTSGNSKGNNAFIDTFASIISTASTVASVQAIASATDSDSDTLSDYVESCTLGTNPNNADSDGDTVPDGTEAPGGVAVNTDGTGGIDALDTDSDDDGVLDGVDVNRTNKNFCQDVDNDNCDDCTNVHTGGGDPHDDGLDTDGDGICNLTDPDEDGDGVANGSDNAPLDNTHCQDTDGDTCDDCTNVHTGSGDPHNDGLDTDGDGLCDAGDPDIDGDGVLNGLDVAPLDNTRCQDQDGDTCDDCTLVHVGGGDPSMDGLDTDGDLICDAGDPDIDGDGVVNGADVAPLDNTRCQDTDGDTCDDCTLVHVNGGDPNNDGLDTDGDHICDLGDNDKDGDGVVNTADVAPLDNTRCQDTDADSCDDCTNVHTGGGDPNNDGLDTDGDHLCDLGDPDKDGDGVANASDVAPLDNTRCQDTDADGCDDCTNVHTGGGDAHNDGLDTNGDGICDATDNDKDGDGVANASDVAPLDNTRCQDLDGDGCDDCTVVHTNGGDPHNDGADADHDGICDLSDHDADNDGVIDINDVAPNDPTKCRDQDDDGCDDCTNVHTGGGDVHNDGTDTDGDGLCDKGDTDDDDDGVPDATDKAPLDPHVCADVDHDKCDDCSVTGADRSGGDPHNDGPDQNGDGICDLSAQDSDGDGVPDLIDLDIDGDGIPNSVEGDGDTDGDGIPNSRDLDSDGDGIPDVIEAGGKDADGDGRVDGQVDANDDGLDDALARTPLPRPDTDGDGIPDVLDLDSDGDGISDVIEAGGANLDQDGDGRIDRTADANGNGWDDAVDGDRSLMPQGKPLPIPDTDGDGTPDYRDLDSDDDGIPDATEGDDANGDGNPDTTKLGDANHDGLDDAFARAKLPPDHDMDGTPDFQDPDDDGDGRSTKDELASGVDTDKDGTPDYLDTDSDGDGVDDAAENQNGGDTDGDGVPDYLEPKVFPADSDGDGVPDYIEQKNGRDTDTDMDGTPDYLDADDDGDGIPTKDERPDGKDVDSDGDGVPDYLDADDDGDGVPTKDELGSDPTMPRDTDGDGVPDYLDTDDDGDGVPTKDELGSDPTMPRDTDKDGTPDYLDTDDDGDGVPTKDELGSDPTMPRDTDKDGIPNYLDTDDDGDGIPTKSEYTPGASSKQNDIDRDGIPNYLDKDSDGDGISDKTEAKSDLNGDKIPDYRQKPNVGVAGGAGGCSTEGTSGFGGIGLLLLALGVVARRRRIGA